MKKHKTFSRKKVIFSGTKQKKDKGVPTEENRLPYDLFQCISWQQVLWSLCASKALLPQNSQLLNPSPTHISPSSLSLTMQYALLLLLNKRYAAPCNMHV